MKKNNQVKKQSTCKHQWEYLLKTYRRIHFEETTVLEATFYCRKCLKIKQINWGDQE